MTIDLSTLADVTPPTTEATIGIVCSGSFADEVDIVNMTANGQGYTSVPTVGFSGGGGAGAVATAVMQACPAIDTTNYDCASDDANPASYTPALGETITIAANTTLTATLVGGGGITIETQYLASEFATRAPCRCTECISYDLTNNGSGANSYTIQTCWDGSEAADVQTTTASVAGSGGTANTLCAVKGTLVLENPSEWVVVENPCP
jgi:hypothetical protein